MPVTVSGGEIHPTVETAWVLVQGTIDQTHGLHELAPVHRPEGAETADAVADGHLIRRLLLVLDLHQLLNRQHGLGKLLFGPG